MKKTMLIFVSVLMISLMSCSSNDDVKQNWTFTITTVQSVSPTMEGYPVTTTITTEQDNLTAAEDDQAIKAMAGTTSMTNGGYTFTTTISVTKAVKK